MKRVPSFLAATLGLGFLVVAVYTACSAPAANNEATCQRKAHYAAWLAPTAA